MASSNRLRGTGHCLCRAHLFTVHDRPTNVANCHCGLCRRHSGMAYSTYFTVEEGQYEGTRMWESKCGGNGGKGSDKSDPDGNVVVYTSDIAQRFFCAQCGSPLLMRYFCTPTTLHIPLGLLDVPASGPSAQVREAYKPRQDIWVKSRAWWLPRPKEGEAEGREQYEEDDPDFMERCDRWKRRSSAEHRT